METNEVKIGKILPEISLKDLFSRKKCYLGISLDNPLFEGETLKALLLWAEKNFGQVLVIVGDYLSRFNERILSGCDEKRAGELAIERGETFLLKTKDLFTGLPSEKVHLTRWQEHLQGVEFQKAKTVLDGLFETNEEFRAAVEYDAAAFVKRQKKQNRILAVGMEEAIGLSSQYILEEIAVFSALSEKGWTVELYPGPELKVLTEAAKGRFPGLPEGLEGRVNVELKISH